MTDSELKSILEAAHRRETEAFKALYEDLEPRIFPFVVTRVKGQDIATDLTQDILTDIFLAIPSFTYRTVGQWYAFVFTIVRRTLARHYASQSRVVAHKVEAEIDTLSSQSGLSAQDTLAVNEALSGLDQITRDIVVLHHWSRYTFGEIAEMLNLSETNVRTRHHRAKATLSQLLNW